MTKTAPRVASQDECDEEPNSAATALLVHRRDQGSSSSGGDSGSSGGGGGLEIKRDDGLWSKATEEVDLGYVGEH